jgi:hypothetical protein
MTLEAVAVEELAAAPEPMSARVPEAAAVEALAAVPEPS